MKSKVISISRGPQFRGGKAAYLFLVLMLLLFIVIFQLIYGDYTTPLILTPIIILVTFIVLDIKGVDIDKGKNRIRTYNLNLWGKTGEWKDLQDFKSLSLDHQSYTIKIRSFYTDATTVRSNRHNVENHGHFLTTLVHKNKDESILMAENLNYNQAKAQSVEISKKTGYTLEDNYRKSVQESRSRGRR